MIKINSLLMATIITLGATKISHSLTEPIDNKSLDADKYPYKTQTECIVANKRLNEVYSKPPPSKTPLPELLKLISYINHGNRVINDMCEMIEEKTNFLTGSDKPNCRYNASFIVNNTIHLFDISENVRSFFLKRKQEACKSGNIQCGELTIILKIVDLINSIVHISLQTTEVEEIFYNIEAISFYELFKVYTNSLENTEILTNITLKTERATSILNRERMRIKRDDSRTYTEDALNYVKIYVGDPIKDAFVYLGSTVGSTVGVALGTAVEGTTNGITVAPENKLIAFGVIALLVFRR
jgi:hypothetical protein